MNKSKWNEGDLIDYLESKYLDGIATDKDVEMYEEYIWSGELNLSKYHSTVLRLVKELNTYYLG